MTINEQAMQLAIQSARLGVKENHGGPFGACIVKDNRVIAVAHNTVIKDGDPTCHAEINSIRLATKELGTHILSGCDIYTTAEPCPMCLAAIYWARIDKIYVSVDRTVAARFGFDDHFFYEQIQKESKDRLVPSQSGILAQESEAVFQQWQDLERELY
ncbi:MAG: nucleoside deaminase [Candidatus Berkiellales bacterium]